MASPHFMLTLFHQLFNTFIDSTGDGPLLARAHQLLQKESAQTDNILLLVPITLGITLDILIRYVVSHVLMSILILETVEKQATASKKPPSSRQLLRTVAIIYRKGGLRFLLNGIGSAYTYWAMHSSVVKLSSFLLPSPVAYIVTSVLLAETHFFWTAYTILPRDQVRLMPKPRDCQRWKALVIPALIYAAANTVMTYVPALFEDSLAPPEAVAIVGLSYIVGSDILIAGFMLFAQLFLLLPSYMVLVLVQASLLPPNCETLVFTRQQQRGKRVGEIFSVKGGPLQVQEAVQMITVARMLCCLELHGKMCLCLVGVAAVVHAVAYSMT
ncbi:unnamed protein product [Penicillium egyptiacum]|uniref:Uncharacterized protein n=1 Tax=Penicillium egyptiacum TaxID=1303716 RepID=A0A9W4K549_9EURO|nr:unnamed protein product [Penicillium egyptiacum]